MLKISRATSFSVAEIDFYAVNHVVKAFIFNVNIPLRLCGCGIEASNDYMSVIRVSVIKAFVYL